MSSDTIMETSIDNPISLLRSTDTMATWSDEKRKDFKKLFEKRTEVAILLCKMTAHKLANMASSRHFISEFHLRKLRNKYNWDPNYNASWRYEQEAWNCGRDPKELEKIASERAKTLLTELPPIKQAVRVIDPDTAKMMEEVDRLKKKGDAAKDELEQLPTQIDMATLDQSMTIGAFRKEVDDLVNKRNKLMTTMNQCGEKAAELEVTIARRLYKGFPGLSDAVIEVLEAHLERKVALDQMRRRVGEQVLFGDSDAATNLLEQFESDEATVSDALREKLSAAMATLKASVKALPKAKKTSKRKASKGKRT